VSKKLEKKLATFEDAAKIEVARLTVLNENLLCLLIKVVQDVGYTQHWLDAAGNPCSQMHPQAKLVNNVWDGRKFLCISKLEFMGVDTTRWAIETKHQETQPYMYVILTPHEPTTVEPLPVALASGGYSTVQQPITSPAQPTAMRCAVHGMYGNVGAYCPECDEERAQRIVCRNVLRYKRDDGVVVDTVEEAAYGDSGYHLIQCGHTAKQHIYGAGRCKVCECTEFLCAHNERRVNSETGDIGCMNPVCGWLITKEQAMEMAQRGQPLPVQVSAAELEAAPACPSCGSTGRSERLFVLVDNAAHSCENVCTDAWHEETEGEPSADNERDSS
jgi:hypothetical protein